MKVIKMLLLPTTSIYFQAKTVTRIDNIIGEGCYLTQILATSLIGKVMQQHRRTAKQS